MALTFDKIWNMKLLVYGNLILDEEYADTKTAARFLGVSYEYFGEYKKKHSLEEYGNHPHDLRANVYLIDDLKEIYRKNHIKAKTLFELLFKESSILLVNQELFTYQQLSYMINIPDYSIRNHLKHIDGEPVSATTSNRLFIKYSDAEKIFNYFIRNGFYNPAENKQVVETVIKPQDDDENTINKKPSKKIGLRDHGRYLSVYIDNGNICRWNKFREEYASLSINSIMNDMIRLYLDNHYKATSEKSFDDLKSDVESEDGPNLEGSSLRRFVQWVGSFFH